MVAAAMAAIFVSMFAEHEVVGQHKGRHDFGGHFGKYVVLRDDALSSPPARRVEESNKSV